eukprot:3283746-Pyramimonas_sp.AAC.1
MSGLGVPAGLHRRASLMLQPFSSRWRRAWRCTRMSARSSATAHAGMLHNWRMMKRTNTA